MIEILDYMLEVFYGTPFSELFWWGMCALSTFIPILRYEKEIYG